MEIVSQKQFRKPQKWYPLLQSFIMCSETYMMQKKINSCVYHHDNTNYTQKYISSITIITHYKLHNEKCMSCIIPSIFQCFWQSTTKNDNKIFAYSGFWCANSNGCQVESLLTIDLQYESLRNNPFISESLHMWIPSQVNPFISESFHKWIPSLVNPFISESLHKEIP